MGVQDFVGILAGCYKNSSVMLLEMKKLSKEEFIE